VILLLLRGEQKRQNATCREELENVCAARAKSLDSTMIFRPTDETSLRHLFSTNYAQELLRLSYIGPVLNPTGAIESSPDCQILDRRKSPFHRLLCEFKFIPLGKEDFAHNGKFDIAIVWNLQEGQTKEQLLKDLLQQNGCAELIILAQDYKAFRELPVYTSESVAKLGSADIVRDLAIKTDLASVFGLCMAARLYPSNFNMIRLVSFLSGRFPQVKRMKPKGRTNVISKFLQTKPPLIMHMHGKEYRWTSEIDAVIAAAELMKLITANFGAQDPTNDDLQAI
jgi:hypothetical protein